MLSIFPIKGHPLGPGGNGRGALFDHWRSATKTIPRRNKSNTVNGTDMTGNSYIGTGKQGVKLVKVQALTLLIKVGDWRPAHQLPPLVTWLIQRNIGMSITISHKNHTPYYYL